METASDYAKVRVQFGRPIGQFQAVKHALADMLVAAEQCAAVAWDAAAAWSEDPAEHPDEDSRALSAAIAGDIALEAAAHCAKKCIQVLGGIGFTWEHDAHFYLKRAMANLQLVTGGDIGELDHEVAALAVGGARRNLTADLPEEAEAFRHEIREVVATVGGGRRPAGGHRRGRADHAALARTVGPWRLAPRAARHRRGAGGRRRARGRTWPSGPGPCPRSSRTGPRSNRSAGCAPPCWGS